MFKKSLISVIIATALAGCGGDDNAQLDGNTRGSIEITGSDFFAGGELSALATDADGIQAETLVYVWSTGTIGTTYTITEEDEGSEISVSANYTDEAGFTEGVGASTPIIAPTLNVDASIIKGPVNEASCEIFAVDETGVAVLPAQATATSDTSGAVTFTNVHFEGTGLLSCTGGTYIDESTGNTLDAPQLRSVLNVAELVPAKDENGEVIIDVNRDEVLEAPTYTVSALTEMAVQNAGTDLNSFTEQAEIINARFGIRFDITDNIPTVIGVDALGDPGLVAENSDRYGSVLALISQFDADNADADISAVIESLATDVADGSFSEATLAALETAQTNLQTTSQVAGSVNVALLDVIGSAVGYNNDPVAAIIEGVLSGTVQNTAVDPLTGSVTVIDPNFEEEAIVAQTDVVLTYGTFTIDAAGTWSYIVDTTNDTVANLAVGDSVSDSITIASVDGTTAEITIRVAALTQVVKISNTDGDTGEILFRVDNLRQGKLSASFLKEVAIGSDGNSKDAYIKLGGSSGSNSESLIDLRIQGDQTSIDANGTETPIAPRLFVRNTDSDAYPGNTLIEDFNENQFYDIDITWDLDATEQITVSLDGEVIFGGSFSTPAVVDSDFENLDQWFADGIQTIQFRLGDNGTTIPFGSYFVDNIEVFSDTAGTTSVFSDDFESYNESASLADASLYAALVYAEVVTFDAGDGTVEATPAVFFDLGGSIASDETSVTGAISVQDINEGEASITAATTVGTYGTFNIEANGSWTYTLDTANATIAALIVGERETDSFTITSFDGTTAAFDIIISGTIVVNTGSDKAVRITDSSTLDAGELRFKPTDPIVKGRMTATVRREAGAKAESPSEDAQIGLFGTSTSSNNAMAYIQLDISGDDYDLRDASGSSNGAGSTDGFAEGKDIDFEISWDATNATDTVAPLLTVTIDGQTAFNGEFSAPSADLPGLTEGLKTIFFRVGGTSDVSAFGFIVDDFVVYSSDSGTEIAVHTDDFEGYTVGNSLDPNADTASTAPIAGAIVQAGTPYNDNSFEAFVVETGSTDAPNQFAEIRDTTSDTGELRYALSENPDTAKQVPLAQGRFEVSLKRLDDDLGDGDAFITLFNSDTNNAGAILDLRIRDNSFDLRSPSNVDTSAASVTLDTFMDVVITWEYPNGDLTLLPLVTVEIDGVRFTTDGFTPDNSATGGVTHFAIRFGDNSGTRADTGVVSVDNLAIYSDTAGTTEVYSDDFESYVAGDSLDDDNADSPYNASTSEAIVGVE